MKVCTRLGYSRFPIAWRSVCAGLCLPSPAGDGLDTRVLPGAARCQVRFVLLMY